MIIRGILLRILKVFNIVEITRLPSPVDAGPVDAGPVDAERPVLVIVEGANES